MVVSSLVNVIVRSRGDQTFGARARARGSHYGVPGAAATRRSAGRTGNSIPRAPKSSPVGPIGAAADTISSHHNIDMVLATTMMLAYKSTRMN